MNTATADGGRALYGIARDHMTVKQLYHLNKHHVPGRAMTIDMVLNICFVFLIGNIFGVLAASNIGYVGPRTSSAITGSNLLRRSRPELAAPDPPGRRSGCRSPYVLAVIVAILTVIGGVGWFHPSAGATAARRRRSSASPCSGSRSSSTSTAGSCRTSSRSGWREEVNAVPDAALSRRGSTEMTKVVI